MFPAIQFSFVQTAATGDEATDGQTVTDVFLQIMVSIEPNTAILQDDIVVGVALSASSAQSKLAY